MSKSPPRAPQPDGISRRAALAGATTAAAAGAGAAAAEAGVPRRAGGANRSGRQEAAGRPNVVVILVDDVGYSDFGCYGGEIATPQVDALARDGVRYANFRTTGVCSATRASLLTGLNPHSAGIGWLTELDTGSPGYRGDLTHAAPTLAETLRAGGYATYHCGKWHLNYFETSGAVGPTDNWPLQRGFDRSYWFHSHSTDFFRPASMLEGNQHLRPARGDDYYITDDLTDRAIAYLHEHHAEAPDRPFFLYLAHPAAHSPLQARREDMLAVRGRYDAGWDEIRRARLARQKAMGLVPQGARAPEPGPGVQPWQSLSSDERRLYARYMEAYAACVARLDFNIGRLVEAMRELGLLDDTLLMVGSDNGGSPDGGPRGTTNLLAGDQRRRAARRRPAVARRDRRAGHLSHVPDGLGHGVEHALPPLQARHPPRRRSRPARRALAGGAQEQGRDPAPVRARDRHLPDHPRLRRRARRSANTAAGRPRRCRGRASDVRWTTRRRPRAGSNSISR